MCIFESSLSLLKTLAAYSIFSSPRHSLPLKSAATTEVDHNACIVEGTAQSPSTEFHCEQLFYHLQKSSLTLLTWNQ